MYEYYMTLNLWRVEPRLVRKLCEQAASTLEWLIELGVEFRLEKLYCSGVERVPRGHSPEGFGAAIVAALQGAVRERGIDIALKTRVDRLLFEDGRVVGVGAGDQEVRAGAVIIATGGLGQNPALLRKY